MATSVLFVSDIAATQEFAAGTVLKSIIRELPSDWQIDQAIIGNPFLEYPLNTLGVGKVFFTQKPNAQWKGTRSKLLVGLAQRYVYAFEVKIIKAWLQRIVDQGRYKKIVLAFQCQVLTEVLSSINFRGAPRTVIMWDHPSWFAREHLLSARTKRIFFRQWFALMHGSDVAVLPSSRAKKLLGQHYTGKAKVLYPFITGRSSEKHDPLFGDAIKIAFAGSPYANQELRTLIEFLEQKKWTIGTQKIQLHLFTKERFKSDAAGVVNRGWLTPREVTDELAKCAIGFLPYPFKLEMKEVVDTSFASKFSIYMAANLPTLYFGPKDTALSEFIENTQTGLSCDQVSLEDAIQALVSGRADYSKHAENTFDRFFSEKAFAESIVDIFDLKTPEVYVTEDESGNQNDEFDKDSQIGPSTRVKSMNWGTLRHQEIVGPVENFAWISLSKFMYVAMRPGTAFVAVKKLIGKHGRNEFGILATRSALFIFSLFAKIFKTKMTAQISRKSKEN